MHIDSPDFASASSDSVKADADLAHKQQAYEQGQATPGYSGYRAGDLESAEADLRQAEAEASRAKARLKNLASHTTTTEGQFILRAPIAGIVSERQVNAGSEVRPDATNPLFVITEPQHLWVLVDLPEIQNSAKSGLDSLFWLKWMHIRMKYSTGKSRSSGKRWTRSHAGYKCAVTWIMATLKLKPEMFARVTPIADKKSVLPRIPNSALVTQGLYSYLFVELTPGVLQRRRVSLATQDRDY